MNPDLFWIPGPWRGRMAVATRPRGGEWLEDEVGGWRRAGLDVVVSLLEKDEAAQLELAREGDVAQSKGVDFIWFPIPDRGVPASVQGALGLLRNITQALEQGKNVAVHCRQRHRAFGIDRDRGAGEVRNRGREGNCDGERRPRADRSGDSRAASVDSSSARGASRRYILTEAARRR
jgi:hypothetical protein